MIQAGVISGALETVHAPLQTQDPNPLTGYAESGTDIDAKNEHEGFYIPQQDGSGDGDADIKPNINAPPPTNEDDEELNEDDDIEEEGGIDDDNIPNLILCQFDYVKKKKNKSKSNWECKLKAGVMHINGKDILFSEAKGDFNF